MGKKISMISLFVITTIAIITSCTNDSDLLLNDNIITFEINEQTLSSRISLEEKDNIVCANWEQGDQLSVWPHVNGETNTQFKSVDSISLFTLSSGAGTKSATFTGSLIEGSEESPEYLNVIYRKNFIYKGTGVFSKASDGSFQCDATQQLLTSELSKAPLILAGVFKKTENNTYSPVGGKLLHGGVLFKINIKGMEKSKVVKKMILEGEETKFIGIRPTFILTENGSFNYVSASGAKSGKIILTSENDQVITSQNGELTVYAYIIPKNITALVSDRNINIIYDDDTEVNVGTLKLEKKKVQLGRCYTVDFD